MKLLTGFLMIALMAFFMINHKADATTFSNNGVMVQDFVYNFSVDGGATGFKDLKGSVPAGAQILRVYYKMDTAFTSGGSATVAIGDENAAARYLAATAYNNAAYAVDNIAIAAIGVPLNVTVAAKGNVGITIATAALTAGKMHIFVEYVMPKQ